MRRSIIILVLGVLCSKFTLQAQGIFHQPLGKSYADVKAELRGCAADEVQYDHETIAVYGAGYQVHFSFRADALYKVEMTRDYTDKKGAREKVRTIRNYYENRQVDLIDLSTDPNELAFVAKQKETLHEIFQTQISKNSYQIKQLRLNLAVCSQEELVYLQYSHR